MMSINLLDPSQEDVLKNLIRESSDEQNNMSVVYGPPGTGKSHLVVSLLFELASKGKKVLFVSQNVEALEVIDRKIDDICCELFGSKQYNSSKVSLMDFCLRLNNREHTTKKYIREFHNRLGLKSLPYQQSQDYNEEYPYKKLSYTNLDRQLNWNIDDNQQLGLDELLYNYLKNVQIADMLNEPIKHLDKINIRKTFQKLNHYNGNDDLFLNDNASVVLRFFSKTNFNITLDKIYSEVDKIVNLFKESGLEKFDCHILKSNSIVNILEACKQIFLFNSYLDVKSMQDSDVDIKDLLMSMQQAIELNSKIEDGVEDIKGLDTTSEEIFKGSSLQYLSNAEKIEEAKSDIKNLIAAIEDIIKTDLKEYKIWNAFLNCVRVINSENPKIFGQTELINCRYEDLRELFELSKKYFIQARPAGILCKLIPKFAQESYLNCKITSTKGFKAILHSISAWLGKYRIASRFSKDSLLEKISCVLKGTGYSIRDILNYSETANKKSMAHVPLKDCDLEQKISILNKILIVYEILEKYKTNETNFANMELEKLDKIFKEFNNDFQKYDDIVNKNIGLAGQCPQLISLINANVRNNKINADLRQIMRKYATYARSNEDRKSFIEKAGKIKKVEELFVSWNSVMGTLKINSVIPEISEINELIDVLEKSELFSDIFFSINAGESITDYIQRTKTILNFSDVQSLDNFVEQNKFLYAIQKELGKKYVDKLLSNHPTTCKSFIGEIVHDLVKAKLNDMPRKDRRVYINDDYFILYKKSLIEQRRNYFIKGLRSIYNNVLPYLKQLKTESNWRQCNSKIQTFRRSTDLIVNAFPIVIGTSKEVARYILNKKELFDFVIFDEASQLFPDQALPSIYRAKKAIVIGDPHQMPPPLLTRIGFSDKKTIDDDEDTSNEKSILDLLIELQVPSHYLQIHYRSEKNMFFEPSRSAIYEKYNIQSIVEADQNGKVPISTKDNLGDNDKKNFYDIAKEIKDIFDKNPQGSFCVLFTNKKTLRDFEEFITQSNGLPDESILISTVTNCQGLEADHSIIYLNWYEKIKSMWFFKKSAGAYKRLNVSVTRQKKSLKIFMANPKEDWLSTCEEITSSHDEDEDRIKSAELLKNIIEKNKYEVNEEYTNELLKNNDSDIDNPLTQSLYDKLCSHYKEKLNNKEFKICLNVNQLMLVRDKEASDHQKHVGFRFDIAIYSYSKKCFTLGIEIDGSMYYKGFSKAFCDVQRQETLKVKGWKVYRIWSTNWLQDIDREFKKLTDEINKSLL